VIGLAGARTLYAESSAVLSWLLGESRGVEALRYIQSAALIITSELTLVECSRNIYRDAHLGAFDDAHAKRLLMQVDGFSEMWGVVRITSDIIARARQPFPDEPIRSLDAIHVASALNVRATAPDLAILSLDDRIRRVGSSLAFPVLPT
jgi:predicted nucleic acid-binding protein